MADSYQTKLWGGRFKQEEDERMNRFNENFSVTHWLLQPDIEGSMAHVTMLVQVGLLTSQEGQLLHQGLAGILADVESGKLALCGDYEDIHTFVEGELTKRIGAAGKRLHTARSRNDQVALDIRLYLRKECDALYAQLTELVNVLCKKAVL